VALRIIQAFPDSPTAQMRLCEGIDAILATVAERVDQLDRSAAERRQEMSQLEAVSDILRRLHARAPVLIHEVVSIANAIITAAPNGVPLHFVAVQADEPARFAAAHSLTVARVAARVARQDPDYRKDTLRPVAAALLHDVGMLHVPVEILAQP